MYVLCVGVGCSGLLCSFIYCIGDRVSCMGEVCVCCLCILNGDVHVWVWFMIGMCCNTLTEPTVIPIIVSSYQPAACIPTAPSAW